MHRLAYAVLAATLALAAANGIATLPVVGISCDEPLQREYGKAVLAFHETFGTDTSAFSTANMRLYGGGFDLLAAIGEKRLPDVDFKVIRHVLSEAFGMLGLVFAFLLARRFGGVWAGAIAAVILLCTPRWIGHAAFNPKDVPFAATYLAAIFFGVRVLDELPSPRARTWVAFGVACGVCLSVRIGGLFPLAFLLAVVVLPVRPQVLLGWLCALALCYLVAGLSWPYLSANPINHTLFVLSQNARFGWDGPMLFRGEVVIASQASRLYMPVWFAITVPLSFSFAPVGAWKLSQSSRAGVFVLLASSFMPLYAIVGHARVYDEVRQFLFVVPPLACMAALGVVVLWERAGRWRLAVPAALALLLIEPALWLATSRAYAYTYFNPLVGGLASASWRYETDYWWTTLRVAAEWCNEHARGKSVYLGDAAPESFTWYLDPSANIRVVTDASQADLQVAHQRYRLPSELPSGPRVLFSHAPVAGQAPFFVIARMRD